jgi:GNAT superfamily N-acetyltransferase
MTGDDVPAGLRLCRASGWNQTEEDWRALLAGHPGGFVAAESEGRVVGTGGSVRYAPALAWVCMILVEPESRGRGIGTRVMDEVLARLAGAGVIGLDATPGGRPVYRKLGFRDGREIVRFARTAPDAPPRAAGVRPLRPSDLSAVLARDREAFGADRGDVLRWAAARAPEYAWLTESDAGGHCFGRPGHHADQLGPVVARDAETARRLVLACLAGRPGRPFFLDAPRDPRPWGDALSALGFAPQRSFTRMYRGDGAEPGRPSEVFAVMGPEFG